MAAGDVFDIITFASGTHSTSDQFDIITTHGLYGYQASVFASATGVTVTISEDLNYVIGTGGNDTLFGSAGADLINSGAGNDSLFGGNANDRLQGGTDNDYLDGGTGQNILIGGDGDDTLTGDTRGFGGIDLNTAAYGSATAAITVTLDGAGGTATSLGGGNAAAIGTDTLIHVDRIIGSDFDDQFVITGTWMGGQFDAYQGSSVGQFNIIQGGAGDDTITGNGSTRVSYADATGGVTVTLTDSGVANGGDDIGDGFATGSGVGVGNDVFMGGVAEIQGSAFADTLTGNDQNNVLRGGAGNDILDGGGSGDIDRADYRQAAAGITVDLTLGSGQVTDDGDGGVDTLINIEQIRGSQFADSFLGNASANRFRGEGGADTFTGGAGNDRFEYTLGTYESNTVATDVITDFQAGDRIVLGGMDGVELLTDAYAFDTNVATTIDNLAMDDSVEDRVVFFYDSGATTGYLYVKGGGSGTTSYDGTLIALASVSVVPAATQIYNSAGPLSATNGGTDTFFATAAQETFTGGDNEDFFLFTSVADSPFGTEDTILDFDAGAGAAPVDRIVLEGFIPDGSAIQFGVAFAAASGFIQANVTGGYLEIDIDDDGDIDVNDMRISVGTVAGTMDATDIVFVTTGTTGNDAFTGGAGNDFFRASITPSTATSVGTITDGDTIAFAASGPGTDTLMIADPLELVGAELIGSDLYFYYEDLDGGFFHRTSVTNHTTNPLDYVEFEFDEDTPGAETFALATGPAAASDENTLIAGTISADTLTGNTGDDILLGNAGADTLIGGDGDDLLVGGIGVDHYDGGNGSDTVSFFDATAGIVIDLSTGGTINDDGFGNSETFTSIENVEGSHFNDEITGDAFANFLMGNDGDDLIEGGGGADVLEGGEGADVFIYGSLADSGLGSMMRDVILDFQADGTDLIDIGLLVTGTFDFRTDGEGANFTGGGNTQARFNSETKILEIDADGDAQADMEIEMQNVDGADLDETDFITAVIPA